MRLYAYLATGLVAAGTLAAANAVAAPGDYRIMLSNRCDTTVNVAVRTRQADGRWRTMGWATVGPRKVKINSLSTKNRVFYLYARTSDRRHSWSGRNREGAVRRPIVSTSFRHSGGPLDGPGYRMVAFRKLTIPEGSRMYTFRFRCDRS
ncbi:MAG: DUF1036 domain-containing protein [Alphaproteobacteria bacterium]|nr:DUF1036 domain-containing protein [Alphaproteobacteria bacterium]